MFIDTYTVNEKMVLDSEIIDCFPFTSKSLDGYSEKFTCSIIKNPAGEFGIVSYKKISENDFASIVFAKSFCKNFDSVESKFKELKEKYSSAA